MLKASFYFAVLSHRCFDYNRLLCNFYAKMPIAYVDVIK